LTALSYIKKKEKMEGGRGSATETAPTRGYFNRDVTDIISREKSLQF